MAYQTRRITVALAVHLALAILLAFVAPPRAHAQDLTSSVIGTIAAQVTWQTSLFYKDIGSRDYNDPNTPCALIAAKTYPNGINGYYYLNPRGEYRPYGWGCTFDLLYIPTGQITPNVHYQNWILPTLKCPAGYSGPYNRQQNVPYPSSECRAGSAPSGWFAQQQCPVGNPIYPGIGVKVEAQTDIPPFPGGLSFTRYYRWNASDPSRLARPSEPLGPMWTHTYSARLAITYASAGAPAGVYAYRSDGSGTIFVKDGSSTWVTKADTNDRLTELKDGSGSTTGWEYFDAATQSTERYGVTGRLESITTLQGLQQQLRYSSDGTHLLSVSDSFSRTLSFTYESSVRLSAVTDPAGQTARYAYNANRRLASVTYPDLSTRTYHYNEPAYMGGSFFYSALTGITDENNNRYATFRYNGSRAVGSEHAGGADKVTLNYNTGSTTVTDALGTARTYLFQTILGVAKNTSVSQPCSSGCGGATDAATRYDSNGNVASRTDFNGVSSCYAYNLSRNLETVRAEGISGACPSNLDAWTPAQEGAQRKVTTEWHSTWRLPTRVAEPKRITTFRYNGDSGVSCANTGAGDPAPALVCSKTTQATDDTTGALAFSATPIGTARTWNYTYNSLGQVLSIDGPRADLTDVTTFSYDASGNLQSVTNAAGHTTTLEDHDAYGRPRRITDADGLVTALAYDTRGRLTSRTVGGDTTGYSYDGVGQLTRVTLPDGSFVDYTYDPAHRLTGLQDNLGNRIAYALDAMGNRLREDTFDPTGALVATRSRVYNALNRLEQEIGGSDPARQITRYGYDNQGNLTSVDGPLGGSSNDLTQLAYDALNRLKQVTDALGGATRFGYDGLDQLASVTDPRNLTTRYTTSGLGTTSVQVSPDTGTTTRTFDAAGNLVRETDARRITLSYSYDALNRLRTIRYEPFDGRRAMRAGRRLLADFKYDAGENALGRLSMMTDPSGVTEYAYDARGRRSQKRQTQGAVAHVVGYGFDAAERLDRITYPSGMEVNYVHDAAGRVSAIRVNGEALLSGVDYHPFGPPKSWAWGNGTPYRRTIDRDGRITSYPVSATTSWSLTYDAAGRITGIAKGPSTQTLAYDVLDRLIASVEGMANYGYAYDANGNRTASTFGAATSVHTIDTKSNRLMAVSDLDLTQRYSYSAAGNITSDSFRVYSYDERNRLVRAARGAVATTYSYNGIGERVRKAGEQGTVSFVYDEAGRLLGEYSGQNSIETIYLGDQPVAVMAGGALYHVYADHLGTPRGVTDTSDRLRWRWDSTEPFGASLANEDPSGLGPLTYNLRFPGQYFDRETWLHYNYYRDYDPQVGRYVQADPAGVLTTAWPMANSSLNHLYGYANNNPLSFSDPQGLQSIGQGVTIIQSFRCLLAAHEIAQYSKQCKRECPDDLKGMAEFIERYSTNGSLDTALIKCMCVKAGPKRCGDVIARCVAGARGIVGSPRITN